MREIKLNLEEITWKHLNEISKKTKMEIITTLKCAIIIGLINIDKWMEEDD